MKKIVVKGLAWVSVPFLWIGETAVLLFGRKLTEEECKTAKRLRVKSPEKVRVLCLGRGNAVGGVTLHRGIALFRRRDIGGDHTLDAYLKHELVHVGQYERLGGRAAFLQEYYDQIFGYVWQVRGEGKGRSHGLSCDFFLGYINAPLEIEARKLSGTRIPRYDC